MRAALLRGEKRGTAEFGKLAWRERRNIFVMFILRGAAHPDGFERGNAVAR